MLKKKLFKDGKLRVGDKILQINGVDVTDARHDQVDILYIHMSNV